MEKMANFVPKLGLAKVYPINDEDRTFEKIVAEAKCVFDEEVARNFIKRRPLVEIYLEPRDPQNGQACLKVFFSRRTELLAVCSLVAAYFAGVRFRSYASLYDQAWDQRQRHLHIL